MKKFLGSFAAIAAAFAVDANATLTKAPDVAIKSANTVSAVELAPSENIVLTMADGSNLDFILKRDEQTGQLMAAHGSHASHASHASHSSHYSGR